MFPSGLWRGHWEQPGFGRQFMHDFTLRFDAGVITGGGRDIVGPFVIRGTHDGGRVEFVKQYLGRHQVAYIGSYDGEGTIHGRWVIVEGPFVAEGPFALSPSPRQPDPTAPIHEIRPE